MKANIHIGHEAPRRASYMPTGDQLDAIIKTLAHLHAQGINIGPEGIHLIDETKKVKDAFPKNNKEALTDG